MMQDTRSCETAENPTVGLYNDKGLSLRLVDRARGVFSQIQRTNYSICADGTFISIPRCVQGCQGHFGWILLR